MKILFLSDIKGGKNGNTQRDKRTITDDRKKAEKASKVGTDQKDMHQAR
ncbi:MAG: hypothetical protein GY793_01210 [Proteobacteria bacterium]|nr:hypothetical protein [Pseudomonadota bacterium]